MKKFFYLTAIAALSFAACTKETNTSDEAVQGQAEKAYNFYFSASAPTPQEEDGTKTSVSNTGAVQWEAGDVIDIWYLDSESNPSKVEGTALSSGASTTFGATLPDGAAPDHFWAAYPAGSGTLTNEGSESFTITVGATDGTFKGANFMAAYSTSTAKSFAFKNAVGIIRLQLPFGGVISHDGKDYTISTIRLKGKETSIRSRGDAVVNIEGGVVSGYTFPTSGGQQNASVTLSDAARSSGYAYIPSFPGTLTNGFAVRYYSEEGNIPAVLTKDTPVTITAGNIKPLSDLTPRIVWDYYVSADGSGDGLTASTPMSIADMESLITHGGESSVIMCYSNLINGATFHFTAGKHIVTAPINLPAQTIYSEATYYTISGDNAATLDGDGTSRIFEILKANNRITVKDITLTNGASSLSGGLLMIANTSPVFSNVTFSNTTSTGAGGAVRIQQDETTTSIKGNGTFIDCTFSGNSGVNGGALVITNSRTAATLTNCTFTANSATTSGGALYSTNGVLTLDGCTLSDNTAVTNGGAILNTTGTINLNGCTISSNTSENGGGAISIESKGTIHVDNSSICSNTSKYGGAILIKSTGANTGTIYLNKCDVSNNTGTSSAGALYSADEVIAEYYINGCSFIDNKTNGRNGVAVYLNSTTASETVFATLCVNNSTFYNTDELTYNNASLVCNKGKTIVVNSTMQANTSKWGTYALGCHKNFNDQYGCLLLNSIFVNTASGKPAIYQTGTNYYAIAKNCIASVASTNSQFTQTNVINSVPSLTYDAGIFTWNGTTTLPQMTKADIVAELSNTNYKFGAKFLEWLTEIGALDEDQKGNSRGGQDTSVIWPGAYQN